MTKEELDKQFSEKKISAAEYNSKLAALKTAQGAPAPAAPPQPGAAPAAPSLPGTAPAAPVPGIAAPPAMPDRSKERAVLDEMANAALEDFQQIKLKKRYGQMNPQDMAAAEQKLTEQTALANLGGTSITADEMAKKSEFERFSLANKGNAVREAARTKPYEDAARAQKEKAFASALEAEKARVAEEAASAEKRKAFAAAPEGTVTPILDKDGKQIGTARKAFGFEVANNAKFDGMTDLEAKRAKVAEANAPFVQKLADENKVDPKTLSMVPTTKGFTTKRTNLDGTQDTLLVRGTGFVGDRGQEIEAIRKNQPGASGAYKRPSSAAASPRPEFPWQSQVHASQFQPSLGTLDVFNQSGSQDNGAAFDRAAKLAENTGFRPSGMWANMGPTPDFNPQPKPPSANTQLAQQQGAANTQPQGAATMAAPSAPAAPTAPTAPSAPSAPTAPAAPAPKTAPPALPAETPVAPVQRVLAKPGEKTVNPATNKPIREGSDRVGPEAQPFEVDNLTRLSTLQDNLATAQKTARATAPKNAAGQDVGPALDSMAGPIAWLTEKFDSRYQSPSVQKAQAELDAARAEFKKSDPFIEAKFSSPNVSEALRVIYPRNKQNGFNFDLADPKDPKVASAAAFLLRVKNKMGAKEFTRFAKSANLDRSKLEFTELEDLVAKANQYRSASQKVAKK